MTSAIVVGAGIFGSSLADHLAGRGWDVTIVEQYRPGHVRASSGGATRLIRFGHGADEFHTALAWRARSLWQEIEADTGVDLLLPCGVAWFCRDGVGWEAESVATFERLGIPLEHLDTGQLAELFPSLRTDDLSHGLLETGAGVLRAALATKTLADRAVRRGATVVTGRATPTDGGAVRVDGVEYDADVVVWACGPWLPRLFPSLLDLRVTQQDVLYFGVGPEWDGTEVPGWIDYGAATYGTGDIDGLGFKASLDSYGPDMDPDTATRLPLDSNLTHSRNYLAHRFPDLADAPLIMSRTCQYTVTVDTRWLIAPHPDHEGVWLLGGGSGHGFKHGPALAEHVAAMIAGDLPVDPRFGLGDRPSGPSLRTNAQV